MVDSTRAAAVVLTAVMILAVPAAAGAFTGTTLQQQEEPVSGDGIEVADLEAPAEAAAGDVIEVSANVTLAEGESARNTTAEFRLDGDVVAEQEISLSPGETTRVTFEVNTTGLEPDEYIHGILVEDSGAQALITVFPADARSPEVSFEVSNLTAPSEATAGETIQVSADVTNPANETDANSTQVVKFRLNGDTVDEAFVTLAPGETTTVVFDVSTAGLSPGLFFHGVFSDQFGKVAAIEILEADGTETPAPNATATPTPNATATPTPNVTATPTPNATATPAPNVTATPTPNVTATPTPNATATPAPNVTATPTPNVTATPMPTEAPGTATPNGTSTETEVGTATSTPTSE